MKAFFSLLAISLISLLGACGGEDLIFFVNVPKSGFSGTNILHEEIIELDSTKNYSMVVQLDRDMQYKVILKNTSSNKPKNAQDTTASYWQWVSANQNSGWFIRPYDYSEHSQIFISEGPISAHLALNFIGCGTMDVEIYEMGGNRLTSSKEITWEGFCRP
ncbi:MAG: hypothetical protein JXQ87_03855 [Bacteroidia bacterium]